MTCPSERPTPEHVQQIALQTFNAIQQRESFFAFLRDRNELHRAIAECINVICAVDPAEFSEDAFAELVSALSRVIEALERYFAKHGNEKDVAQCYFLGDAIRRLKDARHWIAQGLSPDSAKRPSEAERLASAKARAATVWAELTA